eukprot:3173507-Rhodomonas_salina.1
MAPAHPNPFRNYDLGYTLHLCVPASHMQCGQGHFAADNCKPADVGVYGVPLHGMSDHGVPDPYIWSG